MRTTVDLPQDLLRAAKAQATQQRLTLSRLVERALRAHLEAKETGTEAFELLVAGEPGGRRPSPVEVHALGEAP